MALPNSHEWRPRALYSNIALEIKKMSSLNIVEQDEEKGTIPFNNFGKIFIYCHSSPFSTSAKLC